MQLIYFGIPENMNCTILLISLVECIMIREINDILAFISIHVMCMNINDLKPFGSRQYTGTRR